MPRVRSGLTIYKTKVFCTLSPHGERCPSEPRVGRQLIHYEASDIGASYLAAVKACEVCEGPDVPAGRLIVERARPHDDPVE